MEPRALFEELFKRFSQISGLVSIWISISQNQKTHGHAYIQYESKASADKALESLNGEEILGQAIRVEAYKVHNQNLEEWEGELNNLYVKGFEIGTS